MYCTGTHTLIYVGMRSYIQHTEYTSGMNMEKSTQELVRLDHKFRINRTPPFFLDFWISGFSVFFLFLSYLRRFIFHSMFPFLSIDILVSRIKHNGQVLHVWDVLGEFRFVQTALQMVCFFSDTFLR